MLSSPVLFAFNSNIDVVKHLLPEDLDGLELPSELSDLRVCIESGIQKEVLVSKRTLDWLTTNFGKNYSHIGGQAGNMANEAAYLGISSLVHVQQKCGEQMHLFHPRVLAAWKHGFVPAQSINEQCSPSVHFILEFAGKNGSNRFIASYESSGFSIDPDFTKHILKEIRKVKKALVSGFHLLKSKNNLESAVEEIRGWKSINDKLAIHFEMGEYQSKQVLSFVRNEIFPLCDSIGINEIELPSLGYSCGENCKQLLDEIPTVIFHTRDCSQAFSKNIPSSKLARALKFGSLLAAYKAQKGKPASASELKDFKFAALSPEIAANSAKLFTHEIANPLKTLGLGDTFSLGCLLSL